MNDYRFGNFVCMLREKKGLTQAEIAQKLGVTPAAVSKWENGSSKPRVEVLFQLADILGVRPEELMAGQYIPDEALNPDAVKQINERFEYLRKIDSYNTTSVKLRRLLAWTIDWNICGLPVIIIISVFHSLFQSNAFESQNTVAFIMPFVFALFPTLFVFRDLIIRGRSVGKRLTGLIILDKRTGEPIKSSKLIIRNLFLIILQIDAVILLVSGQSVGDRVAHTAVVLKKDFENAGYPPSEPDAQSINNYTAPKPLTFKRIAIAVSAIIMAIVLFGLFVFCVVAVSLNKQKNTEEYKLAYNYLLASNVYEEADISEDDILFNSYSARINSDKNGNQEKTVVLGFILDDTEVYVTCHFKDNKWTVCPECTDFE